MNTARIWFTWTLSSTIVAVLAQQTTAVADEIILEDDFEDNNIIDGSPASWFPYCPFGGGCIDVDVRDGAVTLKTTGENTFLRLFSIAGRTVPILKYSIRATVSVASGLGGGVGGAHNGFAAVEYWPPPAGLWTGHDFSPVEAEGDFGSEYGQRFVVQYDYFDGVGTGYLWREGDTSVVLTSHDPTVLSTAEPALQAAPTAVITFYDVTIADYPLPIPTIPEPGSFALAFGGACSFLSYFRRLRR